MHHTIDTVQTETRLIHFGWKKRNTMITLDLIHKSMYKQVSLFACVCMNKLTYPSILSKYQSSGVGSNVKTTELNLDNFDLQTLLM